MITENMIKKTNLTAFKQLQSFLAEGIITQEKFNEKAGELVKSEVNEAHTISINETTNRFIIDIDMSGFLGKVEEKGYITQYKIEGFKGTQKYKIGDKVYGVKLYISEYPTK